MTQPFLKNLVLNGLTACILIALLFAIAPSTEASRLSDLVKRPPELYTPSQLVPATTASFQVKAKAGKHATLMLSTQAAGHTLPDGRELRIGEPVVEVDMIVPESGVAVFELELPEAIGQPGMMRYVEAIVWSAEDKSDAEIAQIVSPKLGMTSNNSIEVGEVADPGNTMFVPGGDAQTAGIMRSINALSAVNGSERKKELIDTGVINTDRQIDRTLNSTPSSNNGLR